MAGAASKRRLRYRKCTSSRGNADLLSSLGFELGCMATVEGEGLSWCP